MAVTLKRLPIAQQLAVKALLESGKSERHTAKLSGVSRETVRAVRERKDLDPATVDRIKAGLAGKFYQKVDLSLDHITEDKLQAATAQQLMMTAAIGTDKARLIEGKATSRTEYVDASDDELNAEIKKLEAELAKSMSGDLIAGEIVPGSEEQDATSEGQPAPQTIDEGPNGAD